jgi:hypothetical protein
VLGRCRPTEAPSGQIGNRRWAKLPSEQTLGVADEFDEAATGFARINDHPVRRLDELLLCNCKQEQQTEISAAA